MASGDSGSPEDVELLYFRRCTERLQSPATMPAKKLDLLKRLRQVKVNMQVLASSGIGKAVNACRDGSRSELDSVATELVNNWKRTVDSALTQRPDLLARPLPVAEVAASQPSLSSSGSYKGSSSKHSIDSKKSNESPKASNSKTNPGEHPKYNPTDLKTASMPVSKKHEESSSKTVIRAQTEAQSTEAKPRVSFRLPSSPDSSDKAKKKHKNRSKANLEEFDNSTGLTFEDCLDMAASQRIIKRKKKNKNKHLVKQKQSEPEKLPELPSVLNLGASEDPALAAASGSSRRTIEDSDLAMPLKLHTRTAVYSGRTRQIYDSVPTLKQACLDYLALHLDWLGAMGPGVPYHVVKPVLVKCSVEQLERLESFNEHLIGDDDELWQFHFMRDFADNAKGLDSNDDKFSPWRRRYLKARRKQQAKLKSITERLATSQAKARIDQRKTMLTLIDKPPQRKRQNPEYSAAVDSLKFVTQAKKARISANPEKAQLVEQLSSHILPTASAPLSVHSRPSSSAASSAPNSSGRSKAPLMTKTLKQVQRLKANGYYRK